MFSRIPAEMRNYRQWVCWRLEDHTKIPYCAHTGHLASVTDPSTWASFDEASFVARAYSGIGFVLTEQDPYTCIDLDDPGDEFTEKENEEILERQKNVLEIFNSYSERSQSGKGLHIWIKGKVPSGRRRSCIEVYSSARYMAMTGDVFENKPIEPRQAELSKLWEQMSRGPDKQIYDGNAPERESDADIIQRAYNAANGEKFASLFKGEWQGFYPSQSEADFAIIDIIAYYTQNRIQIARIFRSSQLGQRKKAQRNDYVDRMITRSLDRQLPPIDLDGIKNQLSAHLATITTPACTIEPIAEHNPYTVPPGLLGDIARFIYAAAPRPVPEIALAAAIGLMAGICGRAYNVSGTGLNQYILLLATTGVGKEAMANGIGQLAAAIQQTVPSVIDFLGPAEIASSRALIKYFAESKTRSFVSILGEFGIFLSQMNSRSQDSNMKGLRRVFLDIYNKSGNTDALRPVIYSDKIQNVPSIASPALTLLCESTPEEFYKALDESLISQGLVPRFQIIEYYGKRPELNPNHTSVFPDARLIEQLAGLCQQSLLLNGGNKVINVSFTSEAEKLCREFDKFCDAEINKSDKEVFRHIWNRGHIKVLKLAGLIGVGINPYAPVADECSAKWAIDIIKADAHNLMRRFNDGTAIGTECNRAVDLIRDTIKKFVTTSNRIILRTRGQREASLHMEHLLPHRYIQQNISRSIKNNDLISGIKVLISNGELIDADNTVRDYVKRKYGFECFKAGLYVVDSSLFM
jgi:hypothetical protein